MKKQYQFKNIYIQNYGCYFLTMISFAEEMLKVQFFNEDEIEFLYSQAIEKGYMNENCVLYNPQEIANLALKQKGSNRRLYQIGVIKNGETILWDWVKNAKILDWDFEALEYRTKSGSHYKQRNFDSDDRAVCISLTQKILYKEL